MNTVKKVFSILIILCCTFNIWASLSKVKTEHFDIIFDDESTLAAQKIYENCEDIYTEMAHLFNVDENLNIPVFISDDPKTYNGSFSNYPANLIVLNNQAPGIREMTNSDDYIVSMFRHELTHAYLFNQKSKTMKFLSGIFADALSINPVYVYQGFSEGISVLTESMSGRGRINSPDVTSLIKQAKIDNQFPDWRETTGASDSYPSGVLYYHFPALFLQYLQDTYGMDKLMNFFNECSKLHLATTPILFKNIFSVSLNEAWNEFKLSIPTPSLSEIETELLTEKKDQYTNLISLDDTLYCIDQSTGLLVYYEDGSWKEISDISSLSYCLSGYDGDLLISFNDNETEKIIEKTIEGKTKNQYHNYRNGCIVNDNTVCLLKSSGDFSYLVTIDRSSKQQKAILNLGDNVGADYFCSDGKNVFFVLSSEGADSIACFDTDENKLSVFNIPKSIYIKSLSISQTKLVFSYYLQNSFARYGELSLLSRSLKLANNDISGGMNYPVLIGSDVYYIGKFMDGNSVFKTDVFNLNFREYKNISSREYTPYEFPEIYIRNDVESYNPLEYANSFSVVPVIKTTEKMEKPLVGLVYNSTDPSGQWALSFGAGYNFDMKSVRIDAQLQNSSTPVLITADLYSNLAAETYTSAGLNLSASHTFYFNNLSRFLTVSQSVDAAYFKSFGFILQSTSNAAFESLKILDSKRNDYWGIAVGAQYDTASINKNELQLSFNCFVPIKYFTPTVSGGLFMSNIEEDYAWTRLDSKLFRLNVQKGWLDLFLNKFDVEASYSLQFMMAKKNVIHTIDLRAYAIITPLVGMATATRIKLGAQMRYKPTVNKIPQFAMILSAGIK